ncbi:LytTR family DNA-binding domain-containing protein [Mucilaginibacter gossypii]|uniref:LytR/AlgR family response regulator transcription factor n=1 Tax=Mucilaginibacter gossypii TaxID=551996 RepID=UPI0016762C8A|nr:MULTISPECIES: LytTR family DNA-binding domain-containing protein [Mucilaginibacter]QTE39746.1 LytTR family DNA-binding domain-containing protein [Mucilaginibacter gossypii]
MINCIVIDDEPHAIEILKGFIQKTPELNFLKSFENPLEAIEYVTNSETSIHISFADVDMPQISGIELAGIVKKYTSVIITTAFTDYAFSAFEKDVYDYLLKPMTYERFLKSVNKVMDKIRLVASSSEAKPDYCYLKCESKSKKVRIKFDEIYYVESLKNYIIVYLQYEKHITYLTMKEMEENLPAAIFSRVHKSFLVNHEKIRFIDGNQIVLTDGRSVVMGLTYKEHIFNKINLIISKRQSE